MNTWKWSSTRRALRAPAVLLLLASACGSPPAPGASESNASAVDAGASAPRAATTPRRRAGVARVSEPGKNPSVEIVQPTPMGGSNQVSYGGGGLIQNVHVVPVFWNAGVNTTIQSEIGCYFDAVVRGPYIDWLNEYNVSGQSIGRGSTGASVTISPAHTGSSLSDDDIRSELERQIDGNVLPAPDANTMYMLYFPPGISMTSNGGSCVAGGFCAYHDSFTHNGHQIRYGVFPDQAAGSPCATGCGGGDYFQNVGYASSHELMEAVTDPEPNSGWSGSNGEIGDPCNQQEVNLPGTYYTVQNLWSNARGECYAPATGSPDLDPPIITSATPTLGVYSSSTAMTVNGSCFANAYGDIEEGYPSSGLSVLPGSTFNQLFVTVPPSPSGEPGLARFYIFSPGAGPASAGFTYLSSGAVTLSPGDGPMQGGTPVTIVGGPFPTALGTSVGVSFGGVPAEGVQCTSATTCVAYPAAHDPGPVTVTVNVNGVIETVSNTYTFDGPQITSVTPSSGPITGSTLVVVEGINMADTSENGFVAPILFGGTTVRAACAREGQYQASCEFQTPPVSAPGPIDVRVAITHTTGTVITTPITPADRFTYDQTPKIQAFGYLQVGGVQLNGAAPPGGALVQITSGDPSIAPSTTVTVPAGALSANFTLPILPTLVPETLTLTASYMGSVQSTTVSIAASQPLTLTTDPDPLAAGASMTASVSLGAPAPAGGAVIALSASNAALVTMHSSVTVPAGAYSATFPITGKFTGKMRMDTITATYGALSSSRSIDLGWFSLP